MSWWWAGVVGVARRQLQQQAPSPNYSALSTAASVALLVGSTTVVGTSLLEILPLPDTPAAPWIVYAVPTALPPPPVSSVLEDAVRFVDGCDISDSASAAAALAPLAGEITHVFYVDDVPRPQALRNVLSAVLPAAPNLRHVCLLTASAHYGEHDAPFREEMPRLAAGSPWCDLEDVLLAEMGGADGISWSVHRPAAILLGLSPPRCGGTNLVATLCAYAAICRREGRPLKWSGGRAAWEGLSDASDADLVAEHQIWAAVDPMARNEAFNCSNGDVFKWKQLWAVLAAQFEVEAEGYTGEEGRFLLAEAMAGKEALWEEIAAESELVATAVGDVAAWAAADEVLNVGAEARVVSMNKSKEYGFMGFRNTVNCFSGWIDKCKASKMVPF